MPRKSRIDAPGALHHIIVRGIERGKIFVDDMDRNNFLDRTGGYFYRNKYKLLGMGANSQPLPPVVKNRTTSHRNRYESIVDHDVPPSGGIETDCISGQKLPHQPGYGMNRSLSRKLRARA